MTTLSTKTVTTDKGRVSFAEAGEGPPLLILHSLLTDRRAFEWVVPDLPGRVVTLDLPGFGGTDHADPSIEDFADSMAAATGEICGDEAPVVIGNGLGAFVALGMAIRHPAFVRRLVLVGCGATFPDEARPAFLNMADLVSSEGMEAVTPVALRRIYTEAYLDSHPAEAAERARVLAGTDPDAFVNACRALYDLDFTEQVRQVETPALIVVGSDDQATPPDMARHLNHLLPDSTLEVLTGVAHAPQLQDPTGFVKTVNRFLEGR